MAASKNKELNQLTLFDCDDSPKPIESIKNELKEEFEEKLNQVATTIASKVEKELKALYDFQVNFAIEYIVNSAEGVQKYLKDELDKDKRCFLTDIDKKFTEILERKDKEVTEILGEHKKDFLELNAKIDRLFSEFGRTNAKIEEIANRLNEEYDE